jgi:hypothetical protein
METAGRSGCAAVLSFAPSRNRAAAQTQNRQYPALAAVNTAQIATMTFKATLYRNTQ